VKANDDLVCRSLALNDDSTADDDDIDDADAAFGSFMLQRVLFATRGDRSFVLAFIVLVLIPLLLLPPLAGSRNERI
jgi:hypothetical protein